MFLIETCSHYKLYFKIKKHSNLASSKKAIKKNKLCNHADLVENKAGRAGIRLEWWRCFIVWSDTDIGVVLSQNKTTTKQKKKTFELPQMSKNCKSSNWCVKQTVMVGLSDEVSVCGFWNFKRGCIRTERFKTMVIRHIAFLLHYQTPLLHLHLAS